MIENIRKEFKQILSEIDWMDQESKVKAQEKADYIDPKIGYPEFTYNDTHLNEMYKNVIIVI
jgi:membrane metallo-endopeptidase-like protein 1